MDLIQIIGGVVLIISCLLIIVVVLMQESKQSGLSAMTGSSDSYLSKNRGKTLDAKLVTITKIFTAIFFVAAIAMNLLIKFIK